MDAFESRVASGAIKAIDELIQNRSTAVLNGTARTYDHYRNDIGFLQGLSTARQAIDDARKGILSEERA